MENQKSKLEKSFIVLLLTAALLSCQQGGSFEGTYINSAGSEFSIANDTLVVEQRTDNQYLLHRCTGFRLLDDNGKPGIRQHEKEEWTAVYDTDSEVLTESRNGKIIKFSEDRDTMTVGKRKYKRIK